MKFKDLHASTPNQLMKFLENSLQYGFTFRKKVYCETEEINQSFDKFYRLKVGEDLLKSGYGVCWDFCEFERRFFEEMKIPHKCFFLDGFVSRDKGGPTHTFLLFEKRGKVYWFEYSWAKYKGIWEYKDFKQALVDIKNKFCKFNGLVSVKVYETKKTKSGLNSLEFVEHCLAGKEIR